MTTYEIIKNQSKEMLADTIADFIALYLMKSAMFGVSVNYEDYRKEMAENLDSEDFIRGADKEWGLHPKGYGQYCLDMLKYQIDKQNKGE